MKLFEIVKFRCIVTVCFSMLKRQLTNPNHKVEVYSCVRIKESDETGCASFLRSKPAVLVGVPPSRTLSLGVVNPRITTSC